MRGGRFQMFISKQRTTILDSQTIDGVTFGDKVIIEPNAVIYENCEIGENCVIGAGAVLRPYTKILNNTIFGTLSVSEGYNIIGNYTTIHAQCHLTQGMSIGNEVFIAPFFIASNTPEITVGRHGTSPDEKPFILYGVIEDNVRIGINVSVVPGIRIGHDSLIYQNTLITKDIEPYSIIKAGTDMVGRKIGEIEH